MTLLEGKKIKRIEAVVVEPEMRMVDAGEFEADHEREIGAQLFSESFPSFFLFVDIYSIKPISSGPQHLFLTILDSLTSSNSPSESAGRPVPRATSTLFHLPPQEH